MANFNKKNRITKTAQMKVADIKAEIKRLGGKGYSKLNKDELIDMLDNLLEETAKATANTAVEERKTIPGDGMMICSFTYAATMACAMRIITENEYDVFVLLLTRLKKLMRMLSFASSFRKFLLSSRSDMKDVRVSLLSTLLSLLMDSRTRIWLSLMELESSHLRTGKKLLWKFVTT